MSWPVVLEKRSDRPGCGICCRLLPSASACSWVLWCCRSWAHTQEACQEMARGAFGSVYGLSETLVKATPLLLAGLGVGVAFRADFWNIGAEGQLYMGAMGGTWMALTYPGLPAPLLQPLMIVTGCMAGAFWGLIPAVLEPAGV